MTTNLTTRPTEPITPIHLERVAAAVDSHPEGDDAAGLATAIARAVDGDLILASIEPELPLVIPGADWRRLRGETQAMLGHTREAFAATDSSPSSASASAMTAGPKRAPRWHGQRRSPKGPARISPCAAS